MRLYYQNYLKSKELLHLMSKSRSTNKKKNISGINKKKISTIENDDISSNEEKKKSKKNKSSIKKEAIIKEKIDESSDEEEVTVKSNKGSKKKNKNDESSDENEMKIKNKKGSKKISSQNKNSKNGSSSFKHKDNRILEIKTSHTSALKNVIERISGVTSDCSIVIYPPDKTENDDKDNDYYEEIDEEESLKKNKDSKKSKSKKDVKSKNKIKVDTESSGKFDEKKKKNSGGIRIIRLTQDKSILIKLSLEANNFDYFRCDEHKITIGVDMQIFHSYLKSVSDDKPIVLYMNRDNRSILYIHSGDDESDNEETDIEVFLMDITNTDMPIPSTEFLGRITICSDKFHNICKNIHNNSQYIEIRSIDGEISFNGSNEGGRVKRSYRDPSNNKKKDKTGQVFQGIYEIKNLMNFSKCNKLSKLIEIYYKNDFPLVIVIPIAILGKMYVFFSPIENTNNTA